MPSVLIAGGSNFPTRKKEKQNAADDRNMEEFRGIQKLLDRIRGTGMGGISSDDENAVPKLKAKLSDLEKLQEHMKAVNAFFKKNQTLDGCPNLSFEETEKIKARMARDWRTSPRPFENYAYIIFFTAFGDEQVLAGLVLDDGTVKQEYDRCGFFASDAQKLYDGHSDSAWVPVK